MKALNGTPHLSGHQKDEFPASVAIVEEPGNLVIKKVKHKILEHGPEIDGHIVALAQMPCSEGLKFPLIYILEPGVDSVLILPG